MQSSVAVWVAMLDQSGIVVSVSTNWQRRHGTALAGRHVQVGDDYLALCDCIDDISSGASTFGELLHKVLTGALDDFSIRYRHEADDQTRWYLGRVVRMQSGYGFGAVVSHRRIRAPRSSSPDRLQALDVLREDVAKMRRELANVGRITSEYLLKVERQVRQRVDEVRRALERAQQVDHTSSSLRGELAQIQGMARSIEPLLDQFDPLALAIRTACHEAA